MDAPVSNVQPSNTGRVQLPPIKDLVDTLPPPNAYRALSNQATWVSPLHSVASDTPGVQNSGPQRNRPSAFPPAMYTPPPRYRPTGSPNTATASPSVVFSSASSGASEIGDRSRSLHSSTPSMRSVSDALMRTPQNPRSGSSPISSGMTAFPESSRPIRAAHSLAAEMHPMSQPQALQPNSNANLGSRLLPQHSSGGAISTPGSASTLMAISTRLNVSSALNQDRGGHHHQNGQDPRTVPSTSDPLQSHRSRTFSPSSSPDRHLHAFVTPTSASGHPLPPRIDMHPQVDHYQNEERPRDVDHQQNRPLSQSRPDHRFPPSPPWGYQTFRPIPSSSSVRDVGPRDVRSRPAQYLDGSQNAPNAPMSAPRDAVHSPLRITGNPASRISRKQGAREHSRQDSAVPPQGYGLRPARWSGSGSFPDPAEETDARQPEFPGQPVANHAGGQHSTMHHGEEEHGILATRPDRRYPPILPAPPPPQRPYIGIEGPKSRPRHIVIRSRQQGPGTTLPMSQQPMQGFPPKHPPPMASPAHFVSYPPVRPSLPKGVLRHRSKEDLGRALQELTNEANRAIADNKASKKIEEFSRAVQQFCAHYGRYPDAPVPSPEAMEEISHRAVLTYRMAETLKEKILAKKAASGKLPQAAASSLQPAAPRKQKKKPITKEEKQILNDMERIRRKRTAAQQGIKSKYVKRNKKTAPPKQCASCGTKDTPEWRKGPDGPRSLCNACGLHWAKLQRKRKEDGQWIGEGAPPPIDIITLRQVTGVGLQPRFNERGEFEIPGTYKNIPPGRSILSNINRRKTPSASTASSDVAMANPPNNGGLSVSKSPPIGGQTLTPPAPPDVNPLASTDAPPPSQNSDVDNIAIDQLSVEDPAFPQQQSSPTCLPRYGGRGKKRKASGDHGEHDGDEAEGTAHSSKRRRGTSPRLTLPAIDDNGSPTGTRVPPTPAEETIWQRAF